MQHTPAYPRSETQIPFPFPFFPLPFIGELNPPPACSPPNILTEDIVLFADYWAWTFLYDEHDLNFTDSLLTRREFDRWYGIFFQSLLPVHGPCTRASLY